MNRLDVCACYVKRLDETTQKTLRWGAHHPACPAYRESGDIVDRAHDEATRRALEDKQTVRREWWVRREGVHAPFGLEIEHVAGDDVPRRMSTPVRMLDEVTPEPSDALSWRELSPREARELIMIANHGWPTFDRLKYAPEKKYPFERVSEARLRVATRAPTEQETRERHARERRAREAVAPLTSGELEARRRELEQALQALEDEHSMRWCALSDMAQRRGRHDLDPQNRRGVPLWWLEEDFPDHAQIYENVRRARRVAA